MPAGTSWPRYLSAVAGAMISMLAGAQTVHLVYQPLQDMDARVEHEKENLRKANERTSMTLSSSS